MKDFSVEKHGYSTKEVDEYIARRESEMRKTMDDQLDRIRAQREELDRVKAELSDYQKKERLITGALVSAEEKAIALEAQATKRKADELTALQKFHDRWVAYFQRIVAKYPPDGTLLEVEGVYRQILSELSVEPISVDAAEGPEEKSLFPAAKEVRDIIARTVRDQVVSEAQATPATAQFDEETRRLSGVNMLAVGDVLSAESMEDPRYDKLARNWNVSVPPTPIKDYLDALELGTGAADSGFSFEEALHPKEDLSDIMADLFREKK